MPAPFLSSTRACCSVGKCSTFPKRGFRANRFNTLESLESINLGKLAYFIQKGQLDPKETIYMKVLFETGIITKIKNGVKVLG